VEHQTTRPKVTGWKRDLVVFVDTLIYGLSKHWLAAFNTLLGLYVLVPLLAPLLMASGATSLGRAVYLVYKPACHQLPERSYFLFGPRSSYTLSELHEAELVHEHAGPLERQRFLGTPGIGFKIALCQRDLALYGAMFLFGLVFALVRKRLRPLKLWAFGLLLLPLALDGGTQLLMLRESNPLLRTVTGVLAGVACTWLLYPHLEKAFNDTRRQVNDKLHLEAQ
jgi:uncharacterized membrane protein